MDYAEPISGWAGCTTRTYGFDSASNRTSYNSYAPADGGDCQTTAASVSKTSTYDTADRATTTGYTYDALGRTTTVPSADTGNAAGDLTATYHVNDLVRTLTQAGTTTTYTLDVNQDRVRSWTDGTTTSTDHYDTDSDSPAWTTIGTSYKRDIAGPDGNLAATYDSSTGNVRIQITDLHGDVLGVASNNLTTDPGILATFETDEYGNPRDPGDVGDVRYGYLGEHQRAADNPAGITLMGVRLYNPTTGRFLSVDPVYGGSADDYDYCIADPINCTDLDGRVVIVIPLWAVAVAIVFVYLALTVSLKYAVAHPLILHPRRYAVHKGNSGRVRDTAATQHRVQVWHAKKKSKSSPKQKVTDAPSWVKGQKWKQGEETLDEATERAFKERGHTVPGRDNRGPNSEWSKARKYLNGNRLN